MEANTALVALHRSQAHLWQVAEDEGAGWGDRVRWNEGKKQGWTQT